MKLKVLNPDNTGLTKEMIALREKRMKQIARPDTQIDMEVQEKTKICVDSALDVAVTSLELIEKAVQAEKDGYDVIGLYCSGDPAMDAIREAGSIPVIGAGQSSLQIAVGLGQRFSWITSADSDVGPDRTIRKSGIDYSRLASIRSVKVDIATAGSQDQEALLERIAECGRQCMKDGAHVLILGCLVFAGMGPEVSKRLGIPVVDPAYAIVSMAELLYSTGLTHSKRTWPSPGRQTRSWQGGEFFF